MRVEDITSTEGAAAERAAAVTAMADSLLIVSDGMESIYGSRITLLCIAVDGGRGRAPYHDDYAANSSFSSRKSFPPDDSSPRSQQFNHNHDGDYDNSYGNNPSNMPGQPLNAPLSLPPPHPPVNSWSPVGSPTYIF